MPQPTDARFPALFKQKFDELVAANTPPNEAAAAALVLVTLCILSVISVALTQLASLGLGQRLRAARGPNIHGRRGTERRLF